jgi:hypothetical protein
MRQKQRLVAMHCDPGKREPFIATLSSVLGDNR